MADERRGPMRESTEAEKWLLKQDVVLERERFMKNTVANIYRVCGQEPPDGDR